LPWLLLLSGASKSPAEFWPSPVQIVDGSAGASPLIISWLAFHIPNGQPSFLPSHFASASIA